MHMKKLCLLIVVFNLPMQWAVAQTGEAKAVRPASAGVTLYDADPGHLWNRLYAALFLRVDAGGNSYGPEFLDILFWTQTKHLLAEPSHGLALKVLDEFIASHGEKLIESPLKRAVMQRDLWAAYEWTVRMGNIDNKAPSLTATLSELQSRLVVVIKRIALSKAEVEALPDNYAATVASGKFAADPDPAQPGAPFLPPVLFKQESPWACIGDKRDFPLAVQHENGCTYHSAFFAFIRLPEGRAALAAYLDTIKKSVPYIPDPAPPKGRFIEKDPVKANPDMPQIPAGTIVALVRQMVLIDNEGRPVATHLTESVQFRIYRRIVQDGSDFNEEHAQFFYEFLMDRKLLFSNIAGGLRTVGKDEWGFIFGPETELTGSDPFESEENVPPQPQAMHPMQSCLMCHRAAGVFSINSISNLFEPHIQTRLQSLHITTPESEKEKDVKQMEQFLNGFK